MALLMALIVGVIVGAAAGYALQGKPELIPINIALGIVGAILGDALYFFISGNFTLLFTLSGLVSQVVGAAILVGIWSLLRKAPPPTEFK